MAIFKELVELAIDSVARRAGNRSPITHISFEIAPIIQPDSIVVLVFQFFEFVVEDPLRPEATASSSLVVHLLASLKPRASPPGFL